jgi:hypothetical protein
MKIHLYHLQALRNRSEMGALCVKIDGLPDTRSGSGEPTAADGVTQRILYGESGGFPRIQAVVSLMSLELPVACLNTKGALECKLTNLLVGLM